MIESARRYRFQAVHSLPDFPEPWCRTHGHHYTVEVVGTFNHEDADELWIEHTVETYEGKNLNDIFTFTPSTVETLAAFLLDHFSAALGDKEVRQVTVWEDDDRWGRATR